MLNQGSLREKKEQADDYIIPHGDWFEYVSCAHYLAEIVSFFSAVISFNIFLSSVWFSFFRVAFWNHKYTCSDFFSMVMKVIYFGILIASGGLDVMVWLLFGFVVMFLQLSALFYPS